jgi:hypothetical protein
MQAGTSFAIRAFDSVQQENAVMSFSMQSYCLGVGTVVGALALGFGGGIVLTKTAIKDTPQGQTRIERVARSEPVAVAPHMAEAKPVPVPRADASPAVQPNPEPVRQIQDTQVHAAAEPKAEVKPVAEAAPPEQVRQADAPGEPRDAGQRGGRELWTVEREQRRAEREQRRAERRVEREKFYAERKARAMTSIRQRPADEQEAPARPELAFEREEPRPNLFEGLFGRPADAAPGGGRE